MLTLGLMSGTSADGVDGVLVRWMSDGQPQLLAHLHHPFTQALRNEVLALNRPGGNELHRAALVANTLARAYAHVVDETLRAVGARADEVSALGAHGQTVRHQPGLHDGTGYTVQLLNGALLAELTGIDVVCDLRSRDVAAGGQGAPLVPALHHAVFAQPEHAVAVLNLGGIANLSLLPARTRVDRPVLGFDCGPGNALMDAWCEVHTGQRFDDAGSWAAGGRVIEPLLQAMLAEPFFALPPPKSTGRDLFDRPWLDAQLVGFTRHSRPAGTGTNATPSPRDVQATLAELTAQSAVQALQRSAPDTQALLVCGGGARNRHLMQRLVQLLPGVRVDTTAAHGIPVDQVEALAFAWLARAFIIGLPGNLPAVTGARGLRRLGALYPAAAVVTQKL